MKKRESRDRTLGYAGLGLFLLAVVLFGAATREARFENVVSRLKGVVVAKELRNIQNRQIYGVTYRVAVGGREVEREGDVGTLERWRAIRVGDAVDVEAVGDTPEETRLEVERFAGSRVFFWAAGAAAAAGLVLLAMRIRRRA